MPQPWTFTDAPANDTADGRRDALRLRIGDTDSTDPQLGDATIEYLLSDNGNRIIYAAISACKMLQARYARDVNTALESSRLALSDRVKHYKELAGTLTSEAQRGEIGVGSVKGGGLSKSEVADANRDQDRVAPSFQRGQFENDGTYGEFDRYDG